jgi:hypothetical protein
MSQTTEYAFVQSIESMRNESDNYKVLTLRKLQNYFPKDKDGFCEIEHYCFVKDFGRIGEDYESPEELYNRLIEKV